MAKGEVRPGNSVESGAVWVFMTTKPASGVCCGRWGGLLQAAKDIAARTRAVASGGFVEWKVKDRPRVAKMEPTVWPG